MKELVAYDKHEVQCTLSLHPNGFKGQSTVTLSHLYNICRLRSFTKENCSVQYSHIGFG
jgi:hypothetical protein